MSHLKTLLCLKATRSCWRINLTILLLFIVSVSFGQKIDTLETQPVVTDSVTENQAAVHWKRYLKEKREELDSFKRHQAWQRKLTSLDEVDSTLLFLGNLQENMLIFRTSLIEISRVPLITVKNEDSNASQIELKDSVIQSSQIQDTLNLMQEQVTRLLREVDYQISLAEKTKDEIHARDSSPSSKTPLIPRMKTVMEKNMIKDGVQFPLLDISAWKGQFLLVLVSLLYFYWTLRLGRSKGDDNEQNKLHRNQPIYFPAIKASILFLVLFPLSYFAIPVWALELIYLILFLLLYILLYAELSAFKRKVMNAVFVNYLILVIANLFLFEWWWIRVLSSATDVGGIVLLWNLGRRTDLDNPLGYLPKIVRYVLVGAHVLAIIFNICGYINISRMASLTAALGVLQAFSLRAFRDMIFHDLAKQFDNSNPGSTMAKLDRSKLIKSVDWVILICCAVLVMVVLFANLHLSTEVWGGLQRFLHTPVSLGSLKFGYGDLFGVIFVIWLSNRIQKGLRDVFSQKGLEPQSPTLALLPLFRLLVVVAGLLFCFSLLGLGVDKLTVIIGALSVGIGLGLQNVVNNFVSGIILIFEKPFKLGDYVELGDKKGQVSQIGIRSSTLLTDAGAQVVIPNGDLLSGRLVNWTFGDSDIRFNMQLYVDSSQDMEEWRCWLLETVESFKEVDANLPVKIWTRDIEPERYLVSLQIGLRNVQYIEGFRSKFLETVRQEASKRGLKITSVQV